ncbi:MAG: hypothetical protein MUE50_15370 [Pirellulaceae bacterium]|nr:hypothetical protein [Pirellulaceae bacterium]
MTLLLPKRLLADKHQRRVAPTIGCYVGYRDVTGNDAEIADAVAELIQHRRSDVIRNIAWLLSRVEESYSQESQLALGRHFLENDLFGRLCNHARTTSDRPWFVFHRQALWYLFQFAVLCCREDLEQPDERKLQQAVGRACLIASDCLEQSPEPCPSENLPEDEREGVASK